MIGIFFVIILFGLICFAIWNYSCFIIMLFRFACMPANQLHNILSFYYSFERVLLYSIYMFTISDVECALELMGNVILVTVWSTWFASPLPLPFVSIDELYVDFVSSNVDGTRYFPSPWFDLYVKLCAVLPLRFDRVEAADVLLLFREHRREPLFLFKFFN